jgi:TonB-dependent SusC/RagA subfamily outer membrane receptor
MKKTGNILLTFVLLVFVTTQLFAQDRVVYGIVHTLDSIPLIGAEIKVKSTRQTVYTDSLGNFAIACNNKDKIKVIANGFYTENVNLDKEIQLVAINLRLKPGEKNQQYAIGYGYVSENDRTTAVTNLNKEDTEFTRFSNMYDLIRSMGAQVRNGEIIVRGTNSFQGSSAALLVVDDVIVESDYLNSLSPIEVKSIDIIKDGSASVYGTRGSNGVVIIRTKKGGDS